METNNQTFYTTSDSSFAKRMAQGAAIAFVLVTALVMTAPGKGLWILVPITTVTTGGAFGGLFFHLMGYFRKKGGWEKTFSNILCFLVYAACLYFSLIAGLAQTGHWN